MGVKQKADQEFLNVAQTEQDQSQKLDPAGFAKAVQKNLSKTQLAVNEFVKCSVVVDEMKPMIKSVEEHRKVLQLIADENGAPDEAVTLHGTDGRSVTFKAKSETRKIEDMNGVIGLLKDKLTYDDLMGLLKISLTDLDKILSPAEQAQFIKKVYGSRTLGGYTTGE
ncbi:hypothetical protein DLP3_050 [Stenotrophomonas phage vB_SmaS_DLP_3]|nr:hypothetical protein DLP3_050 [Stenotrophomonas phage vB_SmaS_DLP_3]